MHQCKAFCARKFFIEKKYEISPKRILNIPFNGMVTVSPFKRIHRRVNLKTTYTMVKRKLIFLTKDQKYSS